MNLEKRFDLSCLAPQAINMIMDTAKFAHCRILQESLDIDDAKYIVLAGNQETLTQIGSLVRDLTKFGSKRAKVLFQVERSEYSLFDFDQELERSGEVYQLAPGLMAIGGRVLALLRFFEHEFRMLARSFGAREYVYPVMTPIRVLEDTRYFTHFPHHVTFCTHFPEELDTLEGIAQRASDSQGKLQSEDLVATSVPENALQPAVCLPCYMQHRNTTIPTDETLTLTMQNRVFRYEGNRFNTLARLWDFTVRDIVFFGTYESVKELRMDVMRRVAVLCEELGVEARVQLANDPFFLSGARVKIVHQQLGELKYELVIPIGGVNDELAVSSFNLHRDFYSKTYNIRLSAGRLAETACMGFGLERWVYGYLRQKGLDPSKWPSRVAEFVSREL